MSESMTEVMLDLETMGNRSNAAIVSIGAIQFKLEEAGIGDQFYAAIDLQSCLDAGLTIDGSTVTWWLSQGKEAQEALLQEPQPLRKVLEEFAKWLPRNAKLWGNGPAFDNAILTNAYRMLGIPKPWRYSDDRCFRTIRSLAGIGPDNGGVVREGTTHHALDDARFQIRVAQFAYQRLRQGAPA